MLFMVAPEGYFTLHQLSVYLTESDLNLDIAVNLDGGGSTGILVANPPEIIPPTRPLPFVILASIKFQRDSNRAYLSVRDRIGMMLSSLQEGIAGVRVVQAFAREDVEATLAIWRSPKPVSSARRASLPRSKRPRAPQTRTE